MSTKTISNPESKKKSSETVSDPALKKEFLNHVSQPDSKRDDLTTKLKYITPTINENAHINIASADVEAQNIDASTMAKKLIEAIKSLPEDIQKDVFDMVEQRANHINHLKLTGAELPGESDMKSFIQDIMDLVAEKYKDRGSVQ